MKANCWHGKTHLEVEEKPDPTIVEPTDAIVRVTLTAICGSDLHLYDGVIPTMESGDILGHEFMGEIVETGGGVKRHKKGDRVVVAFPISCGTCYFCTKTLFSLCERSNPNAEMAAKLWGHSPAGLFGYSHLLGGYAGGQAEYVRVPFADVGAFPVPESVTDEQVLFLSDIFPTGYMAAENCNIQKGETVAVFGCGPVGQFAIKSAYMLGAERVIAIDRVPERLAMARTQGGAETIDTDDVDDINAALAEKTSGRGPDAVIDAVGMEAHADGFEGVYDRVKQIAKLESDRPAVLRDAIMSVRNGGTVSVPGVYGGLVDKFPAGAFVNRNLTLKSGQTHVQRYMPLLLEKIVAGEIDPSFVITHRIKLADAPAAYETFRDKKDGCIKVVMTP
ncbi:MAG: glutathione-dependent formaldehyde dehydrogenase [Candidatus Eremiobacteraeota bacterium]|nr:glutathione-dependent formaldehyde dehydrogenase [Candidatus Eremiobacteraeota bacterium]